MDVIPIDASRKTHSIFLSLNAVAIGHRSTFRTQMQSILDATVNLSKQKYPTV